MQEIMPPTNIPIIEDVPIKSRLPDLIDAPPDAASKLSSLKLVIVGCGAIGRSIALHLARLKIGELRLIDRKKLKKESLLTHSIVPQEISMPKASSLGRIVKAISPKTTVFVHDGAAETVDLTRFRDTDVVILATDNLNAELTVAQLCLSLGVPLVQAAVHGDTLVAQVRFFGTRKQESCPACGYSRAEWNTLNRQTRFSCEADGANALNAAGAQITAPPTMSVSFLCSLAADLTMAQVLRHSLGLGKRVENTILEYCMYTHKSAISPLRRNLDCPCDHTPFVQAMTLEKIPELSLAEISRMAGYHEDADFSGVSLRLGGMQFCEEGSCRCGQSRPVGQFVHPGKNTICCHLCGEVIHPHPFYTHHNVPATIVRDQWDCRLKDLGVKSEKWVRLRSPKKNFLLMES
jgi:molybdopterin/thiamine biosynthesis adenylyltransferase